MTTNMLPTGNQLRPLYVRIPNQLHRYLDQIKDETGISKSDAVTLILLVAKRMIDSNTIKEMFDEYMLNTDSNIDIENIIFDQRSIA